jgi:nucleotide-binding universal stress UspA family protein
MQILYAADGSAGATEAGRFIAALELSAEDAVTILTVTEHQSVTADEALDAAAAALAASPARLRRVVRRGHPAVEIVRAADEESPDLVVVGSHGRSAIARFLLGSVAEQVARHAHCPVLLVRGAVEGPQLQRVALGVDGSDGSERATDWLRRFPLPVACEVRLVAVLANLHEIARAHLVVGPPLAPESIPFEQWLREQTSTHLSSAAADFAEDGRRVVTEIRSGDPARALIDVAEDEGSDLLVVGSHGQGMLEQFLLGSVSQQVLCHAPCSVLVVRGPA